MAVNYLTHSRKKWRKLGYYVEGTEFNLTIPDEKGRPRPIKKDLHGFSDLIAQNDDEQVYLQVTSWGNISARLRKIQSGSVGKGQWSEPMRHIARRILGYGVHRIIIEGWKMDRNLYRYVEKERILTLDDVSEEVYNEWLSKQLRSG